MKTNYVTPAIAFTLATNDSAARLFLRLGLAGCCTLLAAQSVCAQSDTGSALREGRLIARAVRVTASRGTPFCAAMVAKNGIDLNGNNILTDSYNSTNPACSTGGMYDPAKAGDHGDIATNSELINSVNVGNANIFGRVRTGPGGSVAIGPNGFVGTHSWQTANGTGVESGMFTQDSNFTFPDTALPYTSGLAPTSGYVVTQVVTPTNTTYVTNFYDNILVSGDYYATSLTGKTIVTGKARLVLPNGLNMGPKDSLTIAQNGGVSIYCDGTACKIGGLGINNQNGLAENLCIYCTPNVTSFTLNANASFTGVLVAPNANLVMNGAGTTPLDFQGALMVNTVKMNGHFKFHFDEALSKVFTGRYLARSWNEIRAPSLDAVN